MSDMGGMNGMWVNGAFVLSSTIERAVEKLERELAAAQERIKALEDENAKLKTFRDYFSDKGEGLFFQFGMEGVARYNATHGHEAIYIAPDRLDHPEGT